MRNRFPAIGPGSRQNISAANVRPFAEQLAQQDKPLSEQVAKQITEIVSAQFERLIEALYQRGEIYTLPFVANIAPRLLRPAERRNYVFVLNQDDTDDMVLGIGKPPGAIASLPCDGIIIAHNFGAYEPLVKPQQDLWIAAEADGTPGVLVISLPSWPIQENKPL